MHFPSRPVGGPCSAAGSGTASRTSSLRSGATRTATARSWPSSSRPARASEPKLRIGTTVNRLSVYSQLLGQLSSGGRHRSYPGRARPFRPFASRRALHVPSAAVPASRLQCCALTVPLVHYTRLQFFPVRLGCASARFCRNFGEGEESWPRVVLSAEVPETTPRRRRYRAGRPRPATFLPSPGPRLSVCTS